MKPLHVVVLAAGQGKRMRSALPKVLHPLAGRPLLGHVITTAAALDPAALHIVYGHGGDQVREAMASTAAVWVEQAEQLGTGHAVQQAMPGVPDDSVVLILYGDVPLVDPEVLRRLVETAAADEIGLLTVKLANPGGYGRIVRDVDGAVRGIVEHKDADEAQRQINEVNSGIMALPSTALRGWLASLGNNNAQGEFYVTDVIAMAVRAGVRVETVFSATEEEVLGVNDRVQLATLERFVQRRQAERLMLSGATLADPARVDVRGEVTVGNDVTIDVNVVMAGVVDIGAGASIGPNVFLRDCTVGAGAQVHANCVIEEAVLGEGASVGPFARLRGGTRLAEDVHIGNFVEVKNTNIAAGTKAMHLTYLGDADIGARVNVGAGTITCNYDGANKHRTRIGDGVFIGSGTELVAPIEVGENATIGAGSTVARQVPANLLTLNRAETRSIRWQRPVKKT